jgi:hypothetical protein
MIDIIEIKMTERKTFNNINIENNCILLSKEETKLIEKVRKENSNDYIRDSDCIRDRGFLIKMFNFEKLKLGEEYMSLSDWYKNGNFYESIYEMFLGDFGNVSDKKFDRIELKCNEIQTILNYLKDVDVLFRYNNITYGFDTNKNDGSIKVLIIGNTDVQNSEWINIKNDLVKAELKEKYKFTDNLISVMEKSLEWYINDFEDY